MECVREKDKSLLLKIQSLKGNMTIETHQNGIKDTKRQPEPTQEMVL